MTAQAQLAIGEQVGAYRIVGELGGGGMGMVYRAVHLLLNRPAAIKVLRPELGTYSVAVDRFLNEARATVAIRHPGIVEVYDYGHTERGCAYIAMELLEGMTLGERIAERGVLPVGDALAFARAIAAPLAAAHERGVVHRDLKPDNVFLTRDRDGGRIDSVKLLDFGIAKLESAGNRTSMGLILGTPAYMSPEQCRGATECDHRTDLYALGCILFEMLSGQPPYGRGSASGDLLAAHLSAPVPDITRLVDVPAEVARLVTRLLAKAPDDRPGSAGEVVYELDRHLAVRAIPVVGGSGIGIVLAAAAGLFVSMIGLGTWYRSRRGATTTVTTWPLARGTDAGIAPLPPDASLELAHTILLDAGSTPSFDIAVTRSLDAVPDAAVTRPLQPRREVIDLGSQQPIDVDTPVGD